MLFRKISILFCFVLIFSTFLCACATEVSYEDDAEDTEPLQIYLIMDYGTDSSISKFAELYNLFKEKDKLEVDVVKYSIDEIETMYADILNEISVGNGPDIILINSMTDKYIDITKMSQQNAFADMDILIENSESFDMAKYNKAALDAGIINGKRVFMPISYRVEYMMTVKECFENNNLEVPEKLTFETYLDLLETYYKYEKTNPAMLGTEIEFILSEIINDEGEFNNNTLTKRLFEILKEENKRSEGRKITKAKSWEEYFSNVDSFINTNYLFFDTDYSGHDQFKDMHLQYNLVENMYDSSFLWYEYPISNNNIPLSCIARGMAININSKHKNEAFEFVEYVLSDGIQSNSNNMTNIPVNLKIYEKMREEFIEGYDLFVGYEGEDGRYSNVYVPNETFMPDEMVEAYLEYIESTEQYKYLGNIRYVYHNILKDIIDDYYNDRITFMDLIDGMNSKLRIYYSE